MIRLLRCGLVLLLVVSAGCVSVNVIPTDLPLPQAPELHFDLVGGSSICLDQTDANKLRRYFDELNAFRHAWERLRNAIP